MTRGQVQKPYVIGDEHKAHWAFQPLKAVPVPIPEGAGLGGQRN